MSIPSFLGLTVAGIQLQAKGRFPTPAGVCSPVHRALSHPAACLAGFVSIFVAIPSSCGNSVMESNSCLP